MLDSNSLALDISWCTTTSWSQLTSLSNTSAFTWFDNTNMTGMITGDVTQGLVHCESHVISGVASLSGRELTYTDF